MTCKVIKEKDSVTFVCCRGRKGKMTEEDQKKIDDVIKNLEKLLENKEDGNTNPSKH